MTDSLSARLMQFDDLNELAVIFVRAYGKPEMGELWSEQLAYAYLSDWYKKHPDLAFVAEYDNNLVGGFFIGVRPWWDGNHLLDGEFFVDPQYQNQKIGRQLFKFGLSIAMEKYSPVKWDTWTFRHEEFPLKWYERLGFQEIQEWVMLRADSAKVLANLS